MITEETLKKFIDNRDKIKKLCAEKYYMTNIRLILPGMGENKDHVHLLVDAEKGKVDMIDNLRAEKEIGELIQCPVFLVTEGQIHKFLKEDMLKNPVPIENDEAVTQRFIKKLIPFSKDFSEGYEEDPPATQLITPMHFFVNVEKRKNDSTENSPRQKAKKQKLEKIKELMEDVQEAPLGSEEKIITDWVVKNVNHKILISKVAQSTDSETTEEVAELAAQQPSVEIK